MVFTSNLFKKTFLCVISLTLCSCMSSKSEDVTVTNAASLEVSTESSYTVSENVSMSGTEQLNEDVQLRPFGFKYQFSYDDDKFTTIMFDDEDLKYKLDLASWLKFEYVDRTYPPDFSLSEESIVEYIDGGINNRPYCRTNVDYNSFIDTFKSCFTDKCIEELFKNKNDQYINDNGILIVGDVSGLPTSPCTKELTFEISEQTEEQLTLHCNAKVFHPDYPDKVSFYDYYFTVLMTEQGWKFDTFDNAWLYSGIDFDFRLES